MNENFVFIKRTFIDKLLTFKYYPLYPWRKFRGEASVLVDWRNERQPHKQTSVASATFKTLMERPLKFPKECMLSAFLVIHTWSLVKLKKASFLIHVNPNECQ